jgi:hypothetical protein
VSIQDNASNAQSSAIASADYDADKTDPAKSECEDKADGNMTACSFGLSATSQQYFSFRTNQPPATSQQYFSLRTNQHQPSATSQTNRLHAVDAGRQEEGMDELSTAGSIISEGNTAVSSGHAVFNEDCGMPPG